MSHNAESPMFLTDPAVDTPPAIVSAENPDGFFGWSPEPIVIAEQQDAAPAEIQTAAPWAENTHGYWLADVEALDQAA